MAITMLLALPLSAQPASPTQAAPPAPPASPAPAAQPAPPAPPPAPRPMPTQNIAIEVTVSPTASNSPYEARKLTLLTVDGRRAQVRRPTPTASPRTSDHFSVDALPLLTPDNRVLLDLKVQCLYPAEPGERPFGIIKDVVALLTPGTLLRVSEVDDDGTATDIAVDVKVTLVN